MGLPDGGRERRHHQVRLNATMYDTRLSGYDSDNISMIRQLYSMTVDNMRTCRLVDCPSSTLGLVRELFMINLYSMHTLSSSKDLNRREFDSDSRISHDMRLAQFIGSEACEWIRFNSYGTKTRAGRTWQQASRSPQSHLTNGTPDSRVGQ